ncbi:DUF6786 family protein [Flagellimonas onchidii]|uniref:DUF6786 family protein n=1 Tax=Flagellimonas onchidii TaxID=2562684 RepID=UPI00197AC182|nr:DUF6786 family protein [Allomuricauda onchidii]
MKKKNKYVLVLGLLALVVSCKQKPKTDTSDKTDNEKIMHENQKEGNHNYQSDVAFLKEHMEIIELSDANGMGKVAVAPSLQGRVMTSTAVGGEGQSFGWLNYDLIASGEVKEHFNPLGGEERFWLGPEGGQYSIYFKPGTTFEFDNWYVPKELDTEPFELVGKSKNEASFKKEMQLLNYSGVTFDLLVERTVRLLSTEKVADVLGIDIEEGINMVGFETENILTNTGENTWNEESGMLSIWILSMLNPSDETNVIIPFKKGDEAELGKIVTDYEFGNGAIPADRLTVLEDKGVILFSADGKSRGKIGVSPKRALPIAASYDAKNQVLTLAHLSLPEDRNKGYVNSLWKLQDNPFEGDAVNSYNDGPLEDGSQLGPFYEIESSSPAAHLAKNENIVHVHRTVHLKGDKDKLERITKKLFNLELAEINAF